jgi:hypothetical protein
MTQGKSFRFKLLSGSSSNLRPCPKCGKRTFCPYLDNRSGEILDAYGKCNREQSCGFSAFPFHLLGAEQGAPYVAPPPPVKREQREFLSWAMTTDESFDNHCSLKTWIRERFGQEVLSRIGLSFYPSIGGITHRGRSYSIHWQVDEDWRIHTAKLIQYEQKLNARGLAICKRSKEAGSVNWIHSPSVCEFFNEREERVRFGSGAGEIAFTQCLYGLPQLKQRAGEPVCIVEGYKCALVCSIYFPSLIWLGADSCSSLISYDKQTLPLLAPLKGREVYLFPDFEAGKQWEDVAQRALSLGIRARIHPLFYTARELNQRQNLGAGDIEDLLLLYTLDEVQSAFNKNGTPVPRSSVF